MTNPRLIITQYIKQVLVFRSFTTIVLKLVVRGMQWMEQSKTNTVEDIELGLDRRSGFWGPDHRDWDPVLRGFFIGVLKSWFVKSNVRLYFNPSRPVFLQLLITVSVSRLPVNSDYTKFINCIGECNRTFYSKLQGKVKSWP